MKLREKLTTKEIDILKNKYGVDYDGIKSINQGIDDLNNGKIYTQDQVLAGLGI